MSAGVSAEGREMRTEGEACGSSMSPQKARSSQWRCVESACRRLPGKVRSLRSRVRGGIGDGLLEWEGVIRVEDMNEMRTIYGTWVVTTPKLSFLHFVHEGEVFALIPVL